MVITGAILFVFVLLVLASTIRVIDQYQTGVVLTLGRYSGTRDPGLTLIIPLIQVMYKADMRVQVMQVPPQDVMTKDNVSVKVSAVCYYKITDAKMALIDVQDIQGAISQLAQITLRSTIGESSLDDVLSKQATLNKALEEKLEDKTKIWGVDVSDVQIRSVDLAPEMIRAMAQEAEAERGRRARVVTAQGEFEAAEKLSEAADVLAKNPAAITLRMLATLKEIGAEQNTTIVFPMPQESLMPSPAALSLAMQEAAKAASHTTAK